MLDDDILKLSEQRPLRSLDGLEAGIWAGVEARARAASVSRVVYSWQAAILAIGLLSSAVAGTQMAAALNSPDKFNGFSMRTDLTPSARLIGY